MNFFLRPSDLSSDQVDEKELDRAIRLLLKEVNPLTGFELHLVSCAEKKARPACNKERALLKEALECIVEFRLQTNIDENKCSDDESRNKASGVDVFFNSILDGKDAGLKSELNTLAQSEIERVLDQQAYEDWASEQRD